jgi:hypothetical protein
MVEFSEDSTQVVVNGRKYIAVDGVQGRCAGCAFVEGLGCALCEAVIRQDGLKVLDMSRCGSKLREDGRDIVWQLPKGK